MWIIAAIVFLSVGLGFVNEYRFERAVGDSTKFLPGSFPLTATGSSRSSSQHGAPLATNHWTAPPQKADCNDTADLWHVRTESMESGSAWEFSSVEPSHWSWRVLITRQLTGMDE